MTDIILDRNNLAEQQAGFYKQIGFFGDASKTSENSTFNTAINAAMNFASFLSSLKTNFVDERETEFYLTHKEKTLLEKRALSISSYGKVPYDDAEDFLYILVAVDNIKDMKKIADTLELESLKDESIIRQPMVILNIKGLEKVAFMASAISAILKMFSKYSNASNSNSNGDSTLSSLIENLSSLIGGVGGAASAILDNGGATDAIGHFMSELVLGQRLPMNVIAKNPNMQSPSYAGKVFFGESPSALSLVDMTQIFNKKIAAFPMPQNGAGTTSFGFQNFGSNSGSTNLKDNIAKSIFGSATVTPNSYKEQKLNDIYETVKTKLGAGDNEKMELNRADNAIPFMIVMSTIYAGTNKSPFSDSSFKEGWILSNSVSNELQKRNDGMLQVIRGMI